MLHRMAQIPCSRLKLSASGTRSGSVRIALMEEQEGCRRQSRKQRDMPRITCRAAPHPPRRRHIDVLAGYEVPRAQLRPDGQHRVTRDSELLELAFGRYPRLAEVAEQGTRGGPFGPVGAA
jgi:hypothetical protein